MEINAETGWAHCHNCGHNEYVRDKFIDPLEEDFPDLFPKRVEDTGIRERAAHHQQARRGGLMWSDEVEAPGEMVALSALADDHPAIEYLRRRNFDIAEIRNFGPNDALYYCTKGQISFTEGKGTTSGRIIFPIYMHGAIKGWQARQIEYVLEETGDSGEKAVWNGTVWKKFRKIKGEWQDRFVSKYYGLPGMRRSSLLFGFDTARRFKQVVVVEGPLDKVRVGPCCVGSMGMHIGPDQINLIKTYWHGCCIIRDPGVPADDIKFKRLLASLSPLPVTTLTLENRLDPGATPRESIWKQIAQITPWANINSHEC